MMIIIIIIIIIITIIIIIIIIITIIAIVIIIIIIIIILNRSIDLWITPARSTSENVIFLNLITITYMILLYFTWFKWFIFILFCCEYCGTDCELLQLALAKVFKKYFNIKIKLNYITRRKFYFLFYLTFERGEKKVVIRYICNDYNDDGIESELVNTNTKAVMCVYIRAITSTTTVITKSTYVFSDMA
jgi:hypothetical protein